MRGCSHAVQFEYDVYSKYVEPRARPGAEHMFELVEQQSGLAGPGSPLSASAGNRCSDGRLYT
jgi:hypothetical protein